MLCASLVATAVYNTHMKRGSKPLKPDHFVPKRKRRQKPAETMAMAKLLAKVLRGKVVEEDAR